MLRSRGFRLAVLLLASIWACAGLRAGEFVVVGYLPDYRIDRVEAGQLKGVTDLIYFSLTPSPDGKLPAEALSAARGEKLRELKTALRCRLLIAVGGWERSEGFPSLVSEEGARERFISGLIAFCKKHGFDGVDYDWEHPRSASDLRGYVELLRESKKRFAELGLMLTVAQAGWQDLGTAVYRETDRIHLMAYDHEFPHATMKKSTEDVHRLMKWGCPPEKIVLGVPFYGRDSNRNARAYSEIMEKSPVAPDVDDVDGWAFNGQATLGRKVVWARERSLGGVMIWELGQDDFRRGLSLLEVVVKAAAVEGAVK